MIGWWILSKSHNAIAKFFYHDTLKFCHIPRKYCRNPHEQRNWLLLCCSVRLKLSSTECSHDCQTHLYHDPFSLISPGFLTCSWCAAHKINTLMFICICKQWYKCSVFLEINEQFLIKRHCVDQYFCLCIRDPGRNEAFSSNIYSSLLK